jgi:hypothetical protein
MEIENSCNKYLIPIIIGVTGHRDIRREDVEKLEQITTDLIVGLKKQYSASTFYLLSPLAEGADRLAARSALREGVKLIVPLPMPVNEYKKDFQTEESIIEFNELLEKAESYFEMPLLEGNTLENISYGENRNKQYAMNGAFIAKHSQLLIAFWNGKTNNLIGGTTNIIKYRMEGIPSQFILPKSPFSIIDVGPVYHIVTPRQESPETVGDPFSTINMFPVYWQNTFETKFKSDFGIKRYKTINIVDEASQNAKGFYDEILININKYNTDILKYFPFLKKNMKISQETLIPDEISKKINSNLRIILNHYTAADTLAIKFKANRDKLLIWLLPSVVIAFSFFQLYVEFINSPLLITLYPGILALGAILYKYTKRKEFESKHEDYRAISESLRILFFWNLNGINENITDYYLHKHKSELEWIRSAVSNIDTISIDSSINISLESDSKVNTIDAITLEYWIQSQKNYFKKNTRKYYYMNKAIEKKSNLFFYLGISSVIILIITEIFRSIFDFTNDNYFSIIHHILVFSVGSSLALMAAIKAYAEKMVFAGQAKQYNRMANLYYIAEQNILKVYKEPYLEKETVILDLGKEALIENGDWLFLHRSQPLELPRG